MIQLYLQHMHNNFQQFHMLHPHGPTCEKKFMLQPSTALIVTFRFQGPRPFWNDAYVLVFVMVDTCAIMSAWTQVRREWAHWPAEKKRAQFQGLVAEILSKYFGCQLTKCGSPEEEEVEHVRFAGPRQKQTAETRFHFKWVPRAEFKLPPLLLHNFSLFDESW